MDVSEHRRHAGQEALPVNPLHRGLVHPTLPGRVGLQLRRSERSARTSLMSMSAVWESSNEGASSVTQR
jgi:hypothetical protein